MADSHEEKLQRRRTQRLEKKRMADQAPKRSFDLLSTLRPEFVSIIVVGAGGTGARLLPGLIKVARPGRDEIHVIDHDVVEPRNLIRQNFNARDIGHYKAEIMSARYNTEEIPVIAHIDKVSAKDPEIISKCSVIDERRIQPLQDVFERSRIPKGLLVVSCVDTKEARMGVLKATYMASSLDYPIAWIDCGNDTRSGQVLISLIQWPRRNATYGLEGCYNLDGYTAMPQVFLGEEDASEGCHALDTQTVAVNNTSACATLNAISWILHGISFGSVGSIFSTFNSMEPIPIASVEPVELTHILCVKPSLKFALDGVRFD